MSSSNPPAFAVDVEHLSRNFRKKAALTNVNLQIPVGAVFGLVGMNGAGKTTLIRHLIGSLRAQRGRVTVMGDDPVSNPEGVLKNIGYLSEEDSLPKWMCVGDLIDFSRAIYPTWDDQYASQLSDMFCLQRSTQLRSLSKGQRARVGLLIAIAHRPELLVLDEPSSGLDPIARRDILEAIIRTTTDDGRTVLFSSHLLEEVNRVCDTVAVMKAGRILESLKMEELETRYCELVCRPTPQWQICPKIPGLFGWRQKGQEWSVVADRELFESGEMRMELGIIERRGISLNRWFTARVATEQDGFLLSNTPSSPDSKMNSDSVTEAFDA